MLTMWPMEGITLMLMDLSESTFTRLRIQCSEMTFQLFYITKRSMVYTNTTILLKIDSLNLSDNITPSIRCDALVCNALSGFQVETGFTNLAITILPSRTVFHPTSSVCEVIVVLALSALQVFNVLASLDLADGALESEVRETVGTLTSLISNASGVHSLADPIRSQKETTIAGNAFIVVVSLAVVDLTVAVPESEWFKAFFADMVELILATEDRVHVANVVVETVAVSALSASLPRIFSEFGTVLDGLVTRANLKIEV